MCCAQLGSGWATAAQTGVDPQSTLPMWAWGRQADCNLWAVGWRGSPGARWGSMSVCSWHCIGRAPTLVRLGILPGEAFGCARWRKGLLSSRRPGLSRQPCVGCTRTVGCSVVTEPDPLAFAAFTASHGGNKRRVLQAAVGEERPPCPSQQWGAGWGGCAPALHSYSRAGWRGAASPAGRAGVTQAFPEC